MSRSSLLRLYSAAFYALVPFILLRLFWRGIRALVGETRSADGTRSGLRLPGYWRRISERFGHIGPIDRPVIWLHAVSVGETQAAAPLVRALLDRFPRYRLLVTTMTPTGSATVRRLFDDEVAHCYVPYDLPSAVGRFLDRVQPAIAIVMETELWPNLFHLCRDRGIPVMVANLRLSERAVQRYLRFPRLMRATLAQATVLAPQTQADAERVRRLGAPGEIVHVTGSIKFDVNLSASVREATEVLRGQWGRDRPVWLAASTHEGEEELVLAARTQLTRRFPDHLLVIVPRHPERFAPVARLTKKSGCRTALWSERRGPIDAAVEVLIGDTMGELQLFYGAADVAFIGGSLVPTGGHNLLEAAAVGTPVVFGPHMHNFTEIARLTLERGAGVQVMNATQLAPAISDFMGNANRRFNAGEAGKRMVAENRGAVERTLELIGKLIPADPHA
ncbi:3-deoxy-D-manno-octulosonic acid transferase [Sulfurifustis variabilis]|uniref:3-deoxy-D-manno-octulosonic acid transferase n=1 Tax=Sulfurifustis variabilis TaxID=1675686 RepID=A0A1C7AFY0_9GAMM|nr:lipid IV(A) 3-deoxy-D-manno-octulosonic acid transferase [Sulfurifustis variabilis]BAU50335.1 3-deoxy-D-manno-octulosonic acid transferase [Sulfurifustis variabilis]